MAEILRVSAEDIRSGVDEGSTLLVCAYDDDGKFQANHLDGAIALSEFKKRVSGLEKDTPIVFYCG